MNTSRPKEKGNQKYAYARSSDYLDPQKTPMEHKEACEAYADVNEEAVLGLSILETISSARHKDSDAATTVDFPHRDVPGTVKDLDEPLFDEPMFDEMLSFCSCYHIASFLV